MGVFSGMTQYIVHRGQDFKLLLEQFAPLPNGLAGTSPDGTGWSPGDTEELKAPRGRGSLEFTPGS